MPSKVSLMRRLLMCAMLSTVSACATPALLGPPVADLTVHAKPAPTIEILTSDLAAVEYDNAVEKWGEDGWAAVARICRWADGNKLPHPDCPKP